jgi:pyruvate-formate lyase-activating enzyme
VQGIDVLPYHPSATAKYRKLGRAYPGRELTAPSREHLAMVLELLNEYIKDVQIGG